MTFKASSIFGIFLCLLAAAGGFFYFWGEGNLTTEKVSQPSSAPVVANLKRELKTTYPNLKQEPINFEASQPKLNAKSAALRSRRDPGVSKETTFFSIPPGLCVT